MTDSHKPEVVAARLLALGARRGAAQVLFHAAVQAKATDRRDLRQWTPGGFIPLPERKPTPHSNPANDHLPSSLPSA